MGLVTWFSLAEGWLLLGPPWQRDGFHKLVLLGRGMVVAWSSLAERWISQTYLLRLGVNLLAIYFTGNCYEGEEIVHEF